MDLNFRTVDMRRRKISKFSEGRMVLTIPADVSRLFGIHPGKQYILMVNGAGDLLLHFEEALQTEESKV